MKKLIPFILLLSLFITPYMLTGCANTLSGDTREACAAVGEETLCGVAKMRGFVKNAMKNANDATARGLLSPEENEIIYNLAVEAQRQFKKYDEGADNLEGIVNIVEGISIRLIEYNLTRG